MPIKKQFVELVALLENSKDKKVSSILSQVIEMAESKKRDSTVIYNDDKSVKAIFCFYHKQWELIIETAYGSKASSASKLNTMCKIGVSKWTKQQSDAKKAKGQILDDVASGKIDPSEIKIKLDEVEVTRNLISDDNKPLGYTDEEMSQ